MISMIEHVQSVIRYIGENPEREGLVDTPARVLKALKEMTNGYHVDTERLLSAGFDLDDVPGAPSFNGVVELRDIEFCSLCEHHMLPFFGVAHVTYRPGVDGRVVGVSKIARLVEAYSKRLQVQERLTQQIAQSLKEHLDVSGVRVVMEATHCCMVARGVNRRPLMMTRVEIGEM